MLRKKTILSIQLFVGCLITYMMRVTFSVGVIAMSQPYNWTLTNDEDAPANRRTMLLSSAMFPMPPIQPGPSELMRLDVEQLSREMPWQRALRRFRRGLEPEYRWIHNNRKFFVIQCGNNTEPNRVNTTYWWYATNHTEISDTYQISHELQGILLGAYFWGFIPSTLVAPRLARKIGPTAIIFGSTFLAGLLTSCTAVIATNFKADNTKICGILSLRIGVGFCGGMIYPSAHMLLGYWVPPEKRGRWSHVLSGGALGTVFTWLIECQLLHMGFDWPYICFYIPGFIAIFWSFTWVALIVDYPKDHSGITDNELSTIEKDFNESTYVKPAFLLRLPMVTICSNTGFWALTIAQFGNLWGLFFMLMMGPKVMRECMVQDWLKTGLYASTPFIARFFSSFIFTAIGNVLVRKYRNNIVRKIFVLFSHLIPGLCYLELAEQDTPPELMEMVIMLTVAMFTNGATAVTTMQNAADLAPNFAGSLYAFATAIGSISGVICPYAVGYLINNWVEHEKWWFHWRVVFYMAAIVYLFSFCWFFFFGSGKTQKFNTKYLRSITPQSSEPTRGRL